MKITLFIILFVSFVHGSISTVDIYYALKEQKQIEYLNKVAKHSLNYTKNSMINGDDLLNVRNTNLSKIITNDYSMNSREIEVINKLEEISLVLVKRNIEVECRNLVESLSNDIDITLLECFELDIKFRKFYDSGVYKQNRYDNDLNLKDNYNKNIEFSNNIIFSHKFESIVKRDIIEEQSLSYMNKSYLGDICSKFSNESSKTFINKSNINLAITRRGSEIGSSAKVSECIEYDFVDHSYLDKIYVTVTPKGGIVNLLENIKNIIKNDLDEIVDEIVEKEKEIQLKIDKANGLADGKEKLKLVNNVIPNLEKELEKKVDIKDELNDTYNDLVEKLKEMK